MATAACPSKQPNIYSAETCLLSAPVVGNDSGPHLCFWITDFIYNALHRQSVIVFFWLSAAFTGRGCKLYPSIFTTGVSFYATISSYTRNKCAKSKAALPSGHILTHDLTLTASHISGTTQCGRLRTLPSEKSCLSTLWSLLNGIIHFFWDVEISKFTKWKILSQM